jgi:hypothetical protein
MQQRGLLLTRYLLLVSIGASPPITRYCPSIVAAESLTLD